MLPFAHSKDLVKLHFAANCISDKHIMHDMTIYYKFMPNKKLDLNYKLISGEQEGSSPAVRKLFFSPDDFFKDGHGLTFDILDIMKNANNGNLGTLGIMLGNNTHNEDRKVLIGIHGPFDLTLLNSEGKEESKKVFHIAKALCSIKQNKKQEVASINCRC
tara:strand:+ start:784 stop:1263 length:480 start_codon:yes stop_codon:yes gene_type:complete